MATSSTMSQTSSQSTSSGVNQSGSQGSISQIASLRVSQQTQLVPEDLEIRQAEELQDELQQQFDEAAERRRKAILRKARLGVVEREVVHAIEVVPGSKVPRGRIYRMSPAELDELRRQLKELTETGWIRPSTSPYGAPVLVVPKKGGTLRMCIDYRGLNAITVMNAEPLPHIDDLLDRVQGCRYFTKIDLKSGYHQIAIRPKDQHKIAFQTRYGLYEFVVMPFGLCNAPGTFQHAMNMIFHDYLDKFIVVYLDDILIFSRTVEEHVEHLKTVLGLLRQHQYKVNLEKCEFGRTKILYLGHEISTDGLRSDDAKVASIRDWPKPQTITEVRSFLGMTGYYRPFVKNYSIIASPLTDLTRLDTPWEWTEECEAAFRKLKYALTHYELTSMQWRALLDGASDAEKPHLQALLDGAIKQEQEIEKERKETLRKRQVALLETVPSLTEEQCGEQLQSILTAFVQIKNREDHATQIAEVFAKLQTLHDDLTEMTLKYRELTKEVADLRQAQVANPLPLPPGSEAAIETTSTPLTVSSSTSSSSVMAIPSGPAAGADSTVAVTSNEAGTSAIAAAPRPELAAAGPSHVGPYVDRKAVQMLSKYDGKEDIESWIDSMRAYFEILGLKLRPRR
ncbi:hypothetical protein CBR_g23584 [Chara braunii]|uniref:Reverse transcriptase domain-containing protein n=1 Tax=Chara braunii TaxID=69332 RepID=A0A388L4M3_CHABU|nr:hypothetical protein CBR_g23584 [Chara braunii]|eukprot:GBG77256.1 hypothetical protein CBR_g23584 [Chara braunii]